MGSTKIIKIVCVFLYIVLNALVEAIVTDEEYAIMPKLFHLDNFDVCMKLKSEALYCSIVVQLSPKNSRNHSVAWNTIQTVSADYRSYRHDLLRHAICITTTCPDVNLHHENVDTLKNDLSLCYSRKYSTLGLTAVVTELRCETEQHPIDNYDVAVAIVLALLLWIVIFATFYEGMARYKSQKEYQAIIDTRVGRIIACFSLRKNWSRLRSENTNSETDPLRGIQGVRFYNTQLVIMAHAAMIIMGGPVLNPQFPENLTRNPINIIFINGYCVIQTFMLITGFLISYNFLLLFEKRKKFQLSYIIMAFVHRYVRLTPCLLVMMALHATWLNRLGAGPMWDRFMGTEYKNCRNNWWANLLYIHNYYDAKHMCMQHTWYLATDTQLFLVALIVVSLMWLYQNRIKLILAVALVVGISMPSIVNYINNYDIVLRMYPESLYSFFLNTPEWHATYASALTNFGSYALGLTFGYLFYLRRNKKIITKKIYVTVWWILVWGLPLGVIYYGILIYRDDYQYTRLGAAIYATLQKNLFAFGICIFIYGLTENVGWFLRDCVTWAPLQVLGRLTYCTYLVHVVIIRIRGGHARLPTYISYSTVFTDTVGDTALSYMFATLLALFVELPVSALQKLMVTPTKKTKLDDKSATSGNERKSTPTLNNN